MKLKTPITVITVLLLLTAAPLFRTLPTHAAPGLLNRSLTLGDSQVSATTSYDLQFDITFAAVVGSIQFQFCSNDPIPFNPCTAPSGFDISGAGLSSQTGETGFIIAPGATPNNLVLTRVPVVATPQTVTYDFSGVINPDTEGSYFLRIITYASVDATGPSIEEAGIALAITALFDVTAFVPPTLVFCVGLTVALDCSTAVGALIDLGVLSESSTASATSQMAGATNGVGGLAISIIGTTMTSGINSISPLNVPTASAIGTSQFGLNLRDNSDPNTGANPSGSGTTVPLADYNLVNQFTFRNGDVVASSPLSTDYNRLTVTYLVNINGNQAPGIYTSTLTYVATATF